MNRLEDSVDRIAAETGFSGVVRVDRGESVQLAKAYGLAHRGWRIANAVDTQFAIASGTKGLTALTVVSLIEEGRLEPATTARSVLAEDLPLIDDKVTVEQLLAHPSGIGDYVDEEDGHAVTEYVLPVPVHEVATTEQYLRVLDGYPGKFAPNERFSYSNSGYVVLALIAGRIVPTGWVAEMARPRSDVPSESMRYGLGFWLHESRDAVMLEGFDAGVSFRTVHDQAGRLTHTVLSNTSGGAWPVTRYLDRPLVP